MSTAGSNPDFALPATWFKPWLSSETLEIQSQNQRLTTQPFGNIAAQSSLSAFSRMSLRDRALARSSVLRERHTNGARLSISTSVFGANLSTAARQTPSFLRAAVAVSSTTCFRAFQPAKIIGFYRPRFFRTEAHAMSPPATSTDQTNYS